MHVFYSRFPNLKTKRIKYAHTNNTNYQSNISNLDVMIYMCISKLVLFVFIFVSFVLTQLSRAASKFKKRLQYDGYYIWYEFQFLKILEMLNRSSDTYLFVFHKKNYLIWKKCFRRGVVPI